RHAHKPQEVLDKERHMETDKKQPEGNLSHGFVKYSSEHFGPPVMQGSEDTKHGSSHNNIMKVTNDEIRVMILVIGYGRTKHDAGQPTNGARRDKAQGPQNSSSSFQLPSHDSK